MTDFDEQPDTPIKPHAFELCRNFHLGNDLLQATPHCAVCNQEEGAKIHKANA